MKTLTKILAPASLALAAMAATTPAAAQVQGRIAIADVTSAIYGSSAFQNGYNQINQTYATQIQSIQQKQQQLSQLILAFDTDSDSQLSDTEMAAMRSSSNFAQIQTLQQEVEALNTQVTGARVYLVEQVLAQYGLALSDVTTQQQIVMVLVPDTVQFAAEGADISQQITTALNTRIPTASITPPQGWRPSRNAAQVMQDIELRLRAVQARQAAAAQQNQQQAPSGR